MRQRQHPSSSLLLFFPINIPLSCLSRVTSLFFPVTLKPANMSSTPHWLQMGVALFLFYLFYLVLRFFLSPGISLSLFSCHSHLTLIQHHVWHQESTRVTQPLPCSTALSPVLTVSLLSDLPLSPPLTEPPRVWAPTAGERAGVLRDKRAFALDEARRCVFTLSL